MKRVMSKMRICLMKTKSQKIKIIKNQMKALVTIHLEMTEITFQDKKIIIKVKMD